MRVSYVVLLVLTFIASIAAVTSVDPSTGHAYAQASIVSVETDSEEYFEGDVIVVYGNLAANILDTPVILQIFKDTNPIYINQITPAEDNTYWDFVRAQGAKWITPGEYEVVVRYGKDGKAIKTFNFTPSGGAGNPGGGDGGAEPVSGIFEVDAGNETFDVPYAITGGTVQDMQFDWRDFTLLVNLNVTESDGSITLDLPRRYIGAERTDNQIVTDEVFIVLVDDTEIPYEEPVALKDSRKITLEFLEGDSQIKIIGTYAVPEFSQAVIMVVLAGAMAVVILYGMRARPGPSKAPGLMMCHAPEGRGSQVPPPNDS